MYLFLRARFSGIAGAKNNSIQISNLNPPHRTHIAPQPHHIMSNTTMDGSYHPPMKIVLGVLAGTPTASSLTRNDYDECNDSSSSAVSYILGTSYFASPPAASRTYVGGGGGVGSGSSISGGNHHRRHTTLGLNKDGRVPMADRKGPFDQFKPKSLILSVSDIYFCLGVGRGA